MDIAHSSFGVDNAAPIITMTPRRISNMQCFYTQCTQSCCCAADTCSSSVWDVVSSIPLASALGLGLGSLPQLLLIWVHDPVSEALHAVLLFEDPDHLHRVSQCMAAGHSLAAIVVWSAARYSSSVTAQAMLYTMCLHVHSAAD